MNTRTGTFFSLHQSLMGAESFGGTNDPSDGDGDDDDDGEISS